jgi:transposase
LCRQPGRNPGSVAAELDLTETAVRRWVAQADTDAGDRPGMSSVERDELARLRRENRTYDWIVDGARLAAWR